MPPPIPRDRSLDSTPALLAEGYEFVGNRCLRYGSDLFEARLMLRRAVCATGAEAARVFYEPDRFTRRGAMPPTTLMLLQDLGSAAVLDGDAHRHRKALFLSLMTPDRLTAATALFAEHWRAAVGRWAERDAVVLHHEVEEVLFRTACAWTGVPLPEAAAYRRTRQFAAMIEGAGSAGPRMWRGLLLRARAETWIRDVIERVRAGALAVPDGCPAQVIAGHLDRDGQPLDAKTAAVELINLLRPTVAVARYVTFAALALHQHPEWALRFAASDEADLEPFAHEVRCFYPFFPFVGGRALRPFEWRGHHFAEGTWFLLDLYGINHDPRLWDHPQEFRPERFRAWDGSAFDLIPQGGGDHMSGHRCAGERLTIELVKQAVRLLTQETRYDVPPQDLTIDLNRMPAIPRSRFAIANVAPAGQNRPSAGQGAEHPTEPCPHRVRPGE